MYSSILSLTGENVLAFLLHNLEGKYSIREVSKEVKQGYPIVFHTVKALQKVQLVKAARVSNINQCTPNVIREHTALFGFVSERFAAKNVPKRVWNALQDVVKEIENPFYSLLLFGSYAKGIARPTSDVDVLFIIAERSQEAEITAAVKKSAALNNLKINPVILALDEFKNGLKEESVAREAYKKHFIIKGGELFYSVISRA